MVTLFDLELSRGKLALRIFTAFLFAGLTLFLFYYLPLHISAIASHFVPNMYLPAVNSFASAFASTSLPELGVLLAILVFVETILKGTWVYGALLIVVGSFWILYDLTLYRDGVLFSIAPSTLTLSSGEQLILTSSTQSDIFLFVTLVIIIFVISSFVTIIRGARILWAKYRSSSPLLQQTRI
jgi:hypothetical protein